MFSKINTPIACLYVVVTVLRISYPPFFVKGTVAKHAIVIKRFTQEMLND